MEFRNIPKYKINGDFFYKKKKRIQVGTFFYEGGVWAENKIYQ